MGDQVTEAILTKSLFNEGEQPGEIAVTGVIGMLCLDDINLKNTCLYLLARLFYKSWKLHLGTRMVNSLPKQRQKCVRKLVVPT